MSADQVVPETQGVSSSLLGVIDLGAEIPSMAGYQLRTRLFIFAPGAVFGPLHDHVGRPGTVYVLSGTITDHCDGVARDYGPGLGWPEDHATTHWLENRGTEPAVEVSVDVVRAPEGAGAGQIPQVRDRAG